jgi:two-component system response regulator PilR (NtrC family)
LLVVDDEPDLRTLYEITLAREGYDVECAATLTEASQALAAGGFQAIITDMRLPDGSGLDLLRQLDRQGGAERAIVITAYGSPENAVEALKAGAFDYLTKPVDLRQFRAVVASAVGRQPVVGGLTEAGLASSPARDRRFVSVGRRAVERLIGDSASMQQVRSLVQRVARSMAPVLVVGESGTGKELVARAIHESSSRATQPFVAVNCGAIPDALLEAEFFGYRKGAFTGALEDREGFFQAAAGGTLFLDEIGDLPLLMQSKLLRVIQERAARPVGATAEVSTDVRIISATHRDLGSEVQAGRFRQDLFYRLDVIRIALPPLRERLEDLPAICSALLERIAREAGTNSVTRITPQALEHLAKRRFPGNVRELENLLHRALALSESAQIDAVDVDLPQAEVHPSGVDTLEETTRADGLSSAVRAQATARRFDGPLPVDLAAYLDGVERQILEEALLRHRYNRTAAGASLGMSLRQIRYRMARLGIHSGSDPADPAPAS